MSFLLIQLGKRGFCQFFQFYDQPTVVIILFFIDQNARNYLTQLRLFALFQFTFATHSVTEFSQAILFNPLNDVTPSFQRLSDFLENGYLLLNGRCVLNLAVYFPITEYDCLKSIRILITICIFEKLIAQLTIGD